MVATTPAGIVLRFSPTARHVFAPASALHSTDLAEPDAAAPVENTALVNREDGY
jgi:hypothetical protein